MTWWAQLAQRLGGAAIEAIAARMARSDTGAAEVENRVRRAKARAEAAERVRRERRGS